MNKPLTFLLALTFLFLFSGSVYGEEPEVKREFYDSGKLKKETYYKNGKKEGLKTTWYPTGEKMYEVHYKNGKEEGLEDDEHFIRGDPDTPEDYQALNIEFEHRIDEIKVNIMEEFGEEEIVELFVNNRMEYINRYYNGWRVLEKDDPDKLKEIDESEELELDELGVGWGLSDGLVKSVSRSGRREKYNQ